MTPFPEKIDENNFLFCETQGWIHRGYLGVSTPNWGSSLSWGMENKLKNEVKI